jgi:ABC-type branched-subunit amino acid transport system substrate-binding protein
MIRARPFHLALALTAAAVALAAAPGCQDAPPADVVPIGLLLSYSGALAANSVNSERAVLLAIEAANRAGGVAGRHLKVMARDTRSDASLVTAPARQLVDANVALVIGPDTTELAVQLKELLGNHTLIMPSFTTASNFSKPYPWFVMGAPASRVACELAAQIRLAGRQHPLILVDPNGYNSLLGSELAFRYGIPQAFLPSSGSSSDTTVRPITALGADAYVLAALPPAAAALLYAMAVVGAIDDPGRWYLSPTLHTPALLQNIPQGLLAGAHGVATGTVAGAQDFRDEFRARWEDLPLDDAFPFYDAGAVATLALQRAMVQKGEIPAGVGLGEHIVAVTHAGGTPVRWNEIARGLDLLRQGQEVAYIGLSGPLEFDRVGQSRAANINWWTVGASGFEEVPRTSDCR